MTSCRIGLTVKLTPQQQRFVDAQLAALYERAKGSSPVGGVVTDTTTLGRNKQTENIGNGRPGPGRPKGSPNKLTASIKAAIRDAFDELGGVESLVKWGRKNPDAFYPLWARLAPQEHEVSGRDGGAVQVMVIGGRRIEF